MGSRRPYTSGALTNLNEAENISHMTVVWFVYLAVEGPYGPGNHPLTSDSPQGIYLQRARERDRNWRGVFAAAVCMDGHRRLADRDCNRRRGGRRGRRRRRGHRPCFLKRHIPKLGWQLLPVVSGDPEIIQKQNGNSNAFIPNYGKLK